MRTRLLYLCAAIVAVSSCEGLLTPEEDSTFELTCQTMQATDIGINTATLNGQASVKGTTDEQLHTYFYITTDSQANDDITRIGQRINVDIVNPDLGFFTATLTDLVPDTDYYYVASATCGDKEVNGRLMFFHTAPKPTAITTTGDVLSVTESTAILTSFINPSLVSGDIEMGILYSAEEEFSIDNGAVVTSNELDSNNMFTVRITGLVAGKKYYYKSFVKSSGIYHYGEIKSFETIGLGFEVTVTTEDVTFEGINICFYGKTNASPDKYPVKAAFCFSDSNKTAEELLASCHCIDAIFNEDGSFCVNYEASEFMGLTFYYAATVELNGQRFFGEVKSYTLPGICLSIEPSCVTFTEEGYSQSIALLATLNWTINSYSIPSWVSFSALQGNASFTEQMISISVLENEGYDREADIVFSAGGGMVKSILKIKQKGSLGLYEAVEGDGSKEKPYSVAQAVDKIKDLSWTSTSDYEKAGPFYVKGKIASIKYPYDFSNGTAQFEFSDDGTTAGVKILAYSLLYLNNSKWLEGNTQIAVGDIVVVYGEFQNYQGKTLENVKGAYLYSLNGVTEDNNGHAPDFSNAPEKTIAEFIAAADANTYYKVTGTVYGTINAQYGNFYIKDNTGNLQVYGAANWAEWKDIVAVGKTVTVAGTYKKYNSTHELVNGYILSCEDAAPIDYNSVPAKTVTDFITTADTGNYYKLSGTVSSFNANYCSFNLTDDSGTIYVYSVDNKSDWSSIIKNGGKVTLAGRYSYYSAKQQHEVVNAVILSFEEESITPGGGDGVQGTYGYDKAPMGWLELPATTAGDGRELLVHNMEGGKYSSNAQDGTRNWSGYWDFEEHMSTWVAYPLNNSIKGTGSRSNDWGFDALLPTYLQPDITSGSYGGGWTRGHQIPSADRLKTYAANASTFVPTNMTPQDYDFNCGIWANLEGAVRSYASQSDTLYVVTGCLFENSTRYSGTYTGFAVKIPTHYYKALLFRGSSSYATNGFMACGFIMPHDSSIASGDYKDYITTIDELERQTGEDFFPNLEAIVGKDKAASIESTLSSWW